MFFEVAFYVAGNIGDAEDQPVEKKQRQAGVVLLEGPAVRPLDAENSVEPIEMIQVAGENAEDFELEPAHFQDDRNQSDGEKHAGRKAVDSVLAERHCGVTQQEGKTGYELRAIAQGVEGHSHRNEEHHSTIERERAGVVRKNAHGFDVVNPESAEEQ